ncbi:MAG: hypothetical protein M3R36_12325 [Bacteroidota bacterium]|nr:hypothetical protein [Bacteroidota bacterium]
MKTLLLTFFVPLLIFRVCFSQEIKYDDVSVKLSKLKNDRKNYFASRDILYNADSLLTAGYDIPLSKNEMKVSKYLTSLQKSFIAITGKDFPPSNFFYEGKNMIDTSLLYKIFRKMPKGALLHLHPTAGGSAEWVVKNLSYMNDCYMYTSDDGKETYGSMLFFHPDSVPAGWKSLKILRDNNSITDDTLIQMLSFDESDKGNKKIWTDFENIFNRVGLIEYEPAFRMFTRALFDSVLADGQQYIELRTGLGGVYDLTGKRYSPEECLLIYKEIIEEVKKIHSQFNAKIIFSDFRGSSKERVMKAIAKKEGYDLPYYFHDGESTLPSNNNLVDAVMLNTRRIGHGINLFRFPLLELAVKKKQIALEVCPLSNQILGYTPDLRMHPASGYIKRNIPITLNTDDPQIFNYNGLTYDFWSAFMAWELDLKTIKKLALNSIVYSGMNKKEKKEALRYFKGKWDEFIVELILISDL